MIPPVQESLLLRERVFTSTELLFSATEICAVSSLAFLDEKAIALILLLHLTTCIAHQVNVMELRDLGFRV